MPQEHSLEHTFVIKSSDLSNLPDSSENEPQWTQPFIEVPLFPEATPTPPYPSVIEPGKITEEHIAFAIQDLLSYIGGMRQRAEQRANRSRAYAANTAQWIPKPY